MSGVSKAWLETWHPPYQRLQEMGLMDLTRGSSQPKQNSYCPAPGKQVAAGSFGNQEFAGSLCRVGVFGGAEHVLRSLGWSAASRERSLLNNTSYFKDKSLPVFPGVPWLRS